MMMMIIIIGWGGIGGVCAASSTDDRFPTIAISISLGPPPAPAPPRRDAESPSVRSSSVPRSLPSHLATTLLRGFVHPPSHWGGGTICLRADRIGDMLRTLKSAPGGRRRTGSFLVRFRSSVRPFVRPSGGMTMTPDLLDSFSIFVRGRGGLSVSSTSLHTGLFQSLAKRALTA